MKAEEIGYLRHAYKTGSGYVGTWQNDFARVLDALEAAQRERDEARAGVKELTENCLEWDADYEKLKAENQRLRDALEWYADSNNYQLDEANGYIPDANFPIFDDEGARARAALKGEGS